MAENKQGTKVLRQEIQKVKSTLNKLTASMETKKEKIKILQEEVNEIEKEINTVRAELKEKEAQFKKADYSSVLQKLDTAALSKLSKRQAELLAEQILSGTISSLLNAAEPESLADTSIEDSRNPVDANINVENGKGE